MLKIRLCVRVILSAVLAGGLVIAPVLSYAQSAYWVKAALTGFVPNQAGGFTRLAEPVVQGVGSRIFAAAVGSMDVVIGDTFAVPALGGSMNVTAASTIAAADAAAVIAAGLAVTAGPPVLLGAAFYAGYRIAQEAGRMMQDLGQASVVTTQLCAASYKSGKSCGSDVGAVAALYMGTITFDSGINQSSLNAIDSAGSRFSVHAKRCYSNGACDIDQSYWVAADPTQVTGCKGSVDPGNSTYNVADGAPVGYDGKCPTARYYHTPISATDAAAVAVAAPTISNGAKLIEAVKEWFQGHPTGGIKATPGPVTGPVSQPGTPTTTTTNPPTGLPTSTTSTPTYNYTYSPTSIVTNISNTTTTTTGGDTTTTTTGGPAQPPLPPQPTDCDKHPGSVACTDVGDPGSADPPPNTDVGINVGPVDFAAPGGCPSPFILAFSIGGQARSYEISNAPLCDLMGTMRPIFLALFAASAAIIFYDGISRSS